MEQCERRRTHLISALLTEMTPEETVQYRLLSGIIDAFSEGAEIDRHSGVKIGHFILPEIEELNKLLQRVLQRVESVQPDYIRNNDNRCCARCQQRQQQTVLQPQNT